MRTVSMANPLRGERVLDIACGTGNAAILAARFGASATGVDQAPRLIEVARQRARHEGLQVSFTVGDAQQLDFADTSFDLVLSIFGLVFAADREKAFAEMVRVLKPGGRAFFTLWLPGGPIDEMVSMLVRAVSAATGSSRQAPEFEWHDASAVQALADRHGVSAGFHEAEIQFVAPSPEEYFANQADHPMSVAMRPALEATGTLDDVSAKALEILRSGNEDPGGFRVTSRYRIVELRGRLALRWAMGGWT